MLNWFDCLFSGPTKCCAYCPGHTDNFWAVACFPADLDLLFAHHPNNKESFNSESRIHQLREYTTSHWQVVKLSINFGLICHLSRLKTDQSFFFLWNAKITLMWKLFLVSIYFSLHLSFSRRKQKSSVRKKCRKLELLMRVWLCVCDQLQCRIVMPVALEVKVKTTELRMLWVGRHI